MRKFRDGLRVRFVGIAAGRARVDVEPGTLGRIKAYTAGHPYPYLVKFKGQSYRSMFVQSELEAAPKTPKPVVENKKGTVHLRLTPEQAMGVYHALCRLETNYGRAPHSYIHALYMAVTPDSAERLRLLRLAQDTDKALR
jgi:hypothetical protein